MTGGTTSTISNPIRASPRVLARPPSSDVRGLALLQGISTVNTPSHQRSLTALTVAIAIGLNGLAVLLTPTAALVTLWLGCVLVGITIVGFGRNRGDINNHR
jgi:hypothetical protein